MNKLVAAFDDHFIPEWRKCLKFASVQFGVIATVGTSAWLGLSDEQHAFIASTLHIKPSWVLPIGCVYAIYLRLKAAPTKATE
jgi:hypothetical protein